MSSRKRYGKLAGCRSDERSGYLKLLDEVGAIWHRLRINGWLHVQVVGPVRERARQAYDRWTGMQNVPTRQELEWIIAAYGRLPAYIRTMAELGKDASILWPESRRKVAVRMFARSKGTDWIEGAEPALPSGTPAMRENMIWSSARGVEVTVKAGCSVETFFAVLRDMRAHILAKWEKMNAPFRAENKPQVSTPIAPKPASEKSEKAMKVAA